LTHPEGIRLFPLENATGSRAVVSNLGATLLSLTMPDRDGQHESVVLGLPSPSDYLGPHPYFGAIVGRYGNRIARGRFTLGGQEYQLACNNGPNHLHGGPGGFHHAIWTAQEGSPEGGASIQLSYRSPDGEEGYPGTLDVVVTYTLTQDNRLAIVYESQADQPTPVNLTHHSYFNLAGEASGQILDHEVALWASRFAPVDETQIPTGRLLEVANSPFDFRTARRIGSQITNPHPQLVAAGGFDHTFLIDGEPGALKLAARVRDPRSGRIMTVHTTEPGVQFYTGNSLDGSIKGPGGGIYGRHTGFCLETQHFPDSPNQAVFPSTILEPGQTRRSKTIYAFSTDES
jgi:aldose 1-epimerase